MDDCPTLGSLTTLATCREFTVVVCRLVQFCFASVKGYFPANSSVHVCFIFQPNTTEWSCVGSITNTFNPTLILPCLHLWNLRNCGSMPCLRNPESCFDVRNNILYAGHHMHPQVLRDYRIVGTLWGLRCHISIVADSQLQHRIIGVFPFTPSPNSRPAPAQTYLHPHLPSSYLPFRPGDKHLTMKKNWSFLFACASLLHFPSSSF